VTEQVSPTSRRRSRPGDARPRPLDLPPTTFETEAVWYCPEPTQLEGSSDAALLASLHAAEHSMIALLPLWAMCDRWDIGGLSTNLHSRPGAPTVFVYDGHAGGVGIAERGFERSRAGSRTPRSCSRLPVRARLPVVRPEPEVRQPQRAARQGGARTLLRRMSNPDEPCVVPGGHSSKRETHK
jgi:DEAD/DEAH box helicase domain-containing protein